MVLLGGCDALFGLYEVHPGIDAKIGIDVAIDVAMEAGCADGVREAYVDLTMYPRIAGCNGGWSVRGIKAPATTCGASGNNSTNPTGLNCSIADLCAPGWHVCTTPVDVATSSNGDGCTPITGTAFYTTQVTGSGAASCDGNGTNDFFGCGTIGQPNVAANCVPLDRFGQGTGTDTTCVGLPVGGWDCSGPTTDEAQNVTKRMDDSGGALCCRN